MTEKTLNQEYKILEAPFELIMCPFCGARLNRVGKAYEGHPKLLPTSCHECGHERFEPKVLLVVKVKEIKDKIKCKYCEEEYENEYDAENCVECGGRKEHEVE